MANSDVTTFSQLQEALEAAKNYINTADETVTNRVAQTENDIATLQTNTYTKTETDALIADVSADLSDSSYLPLTGGTLSGNIYINNTTGDVGVVASRTDTGSNIQLLIGSGGYSRGLYQTNADGYNGWLIYQNASNNVYITAYNGTNTSNLFISPAGELTFRGYEVERVEAKSLSRPGYIKFVSGFIVQWLGATATTSGTTVTWPTAWSDSLSYRAAVSRQSESATDTTNIFNYQHVSTTTGMVISSSSNSVVAIIAVGY